MKLYELLRIAAPNAGKDLEQLRIFFCEDDDIIEIPVTMRSIIYYIDAEVAEIWPDYSTEEGSTLQICLSSNPVKYNDPVMTKTRPHILR